MISADKLMAKGYKFIIPLPRVSPALIFRESNYEKARNIRVRGVFACTGPMRFETQLNTW